MDIAIVDQSGNFLRTVSLPNFAFNESFVLLPSVITDIFCLEA